MTCSSSTPTPKYVTLWAGGSSRGSSRSKRSRLGLRARPVPHVCLQPSRCRPVTQVSYGAVRAIFPFKPRDTVTRVALRELPPPLGGTALLLRAVSHPDMPPRSTHVRAKILRGMHYVQPVMQRPSVTNFTFTQQVPIAPIPTHIPSPARPSARFFVMDEAVIREARVYANARHAPLL